MNSTPSFECARSCRVLCAESQLTQPQLPKLQSLSTGAATVWAARLCSAALCALETPWKSGIQPAQHAAPPAP